VRRTELVPLGLTACAAVAAGVLHYADAPPLAAFIVAAIALAGLAWVVAHATEAVGQRFGPAVTGVLQSTLGNLPEFFIVVFALSAGEVVVAQTSLIGSIFANALLVLGAVLVVGARVSDDGCMRFATRLPNDTATLLLLAVFIIVAVGLSLSSSDRASEHITAISAIGAGCILAVYLAWVIPYARSDTPAVESEPGVEPGIPFGTAVAMLAVAGAAAAFVSDWFIDALDPALDTLNVSKPFAGIVIVAIAGNAVENVTGIVLAAKGKPDLSISVVKNSVAQIAAFLFPALILVSLFFSSHLTFELEPIYIGALLLTALVVWQVTGDGEAFAYEGWALIALYVILATFAWYE
jgi:Ca2+:H+ antiporter